MKNETGTKGLQNMHQNLHYCGQCVRFAPLASELLAVPKCLLPTRCPNLSCADLFLLFHFSAVVRQIPSQAQVCTIWEVASDMRVWAHSLRMIDIIASLV